MKVAISIPDKTFHALEELVVAQGISRSALYNQALEKMLKGIEDAARTEEMNRVFEHIALEPRILRQQARRILESEAW